MQILYIVPIIQVKSIELSYWDNLKPIEFILTFYRDKEDNETTMGIKGKYNIDTGWLHIGNEEKLKLSENNIDIIDFLDRCENLLSKY